MNKVLISGLIALTTLLGACSSQEAATKEPKKEVKQETKQEPKQETTQINDLAAVEKYLNEKGFKLTNKDQQMYQMIQAINGYGYTTANGNEIEIYEFKSDAPETTFPDTTIVRNGKFLLVVYNKNDDLIKAFKDMK
ncbi:hypothetical protein [Bacillus sp. UNCCL81]|uniref:hypothetical protein n=1 Tax=Bacillus sp. UNCCL81 TaxID=1502755 RepID=UPI0008F377D2|nr:hypothetical protein [Bacillus sp. UNCCL81]SFD43756.1 hypothetical protein SAMN02799633_03809 [Bacillus sp. UNCCL81]